MWSHAGIDSGVTAYGYLAANNLSNAVGDTQYIRFRWNRRDTTGTNDGQWAHSDDGVRWNTLGDVSGLTTVFDTVTDLAIDLYYLGKLGVAADKYIRFDSIVCYPIMSGTQQKMIKQYHSQAQHQ